MEIIWMVLAGICLIGLIFFGLYTFLMGYALVWEDRAEQAAKIAEEPKICFDGCNRFESQMVVDRLLAADKQKRKRVY